MPLPAKLLTQALAHHRTGRLAEATLLYEQILQAEPAHPDALHCLGQLHLEQGAVARAESFLARAVAARPSAATYHLNHGLSLRRLGRAPEALAALVRAQSLDRSLAEPHHQAGNVLKSLGRYAEATAALRQAVRLAPKHDAAWLNLGVACLDGGARDEAIAAFQRALVLEPKRPEAHNILGHALLAAGRTSEAEAAFNEALRQRPRFAPAHDNLGRLCRAAGRLREAVAHYRAALAEQPNPNTHSNLLFALNFLPDVTPEDIFAEHRRWHTLYAAPLTAAAPQTVQRSTSGRRLRIGYLSPDFCHHAVAYFIEPVLAAHDRTRFEIFCYANVPSPDRFTSRLRALAEHWHDIARLDDEAAASLIRSHELDLLIDLAGHSAGHRLLVLARRPAPLQATWIGYPNTTGLEAIDYRITDHVSDPSGQTEPFYSEKLVRLLGPFSCYQPDSDAPPVNTLPAAVAGVVTFGCFNQFAKITPAAIELWSRILTAVPASRLLLKSRGLGDPSLAARIRSFFAAGGVAPERLTLNGDELSVHDHLSLYHGVDIALDPFPYTGTTTTCEALCMGVPVVTLAGRTHVARVGASLLTHAGLSDWIAATPDHYAEIAIAAAQDIPRLAELRGKLRDQVIHDAFLFTRGFEDACETMVTRANGS